MSTSWKVGFVSVLFILMVVVVFFVWPFTAGDEVPLPARTGLNSTLEAMVDKAATDLAELQLTATSVVATYEAPAPTIELDLLEACETWKIGNVPEEVLIESNQDMARLSLEYAYGASATLVCAEIDPTYMNEASFYLLNVVVTLEILNSWLIQEEEGGDG